MPTAGLPASPLLAKLYIYREYHTLDIHQRVHLTCWDYTLKYKWPFGKKGVSDATSVSDTLTEQESAGHNKAIECDERTCVNLTTIVLPVNRESLSLLVLRTKG